MKAFIHILAVAACCCLAACASSAPRAIPPDHPIIGTWVYQTNGETWKREFTSYGTCILYAPTGQIFWANDFVVVNAAVVEVINSSDRARLRHEILPDGRLLVENRYIATKVAVQADAAPAPKN